MTGPSRDTSPFSPSPPPPSRPSRARPKPPPRSSRAQPASRSSTTSRGTSTRPARGVANGGTASPRPKTPVTYESSGEEDTLADDDADEGSVAGPSGSTRVSLSPELMAPVEAAAAKGGAEVLASLVAAAVASDDGPVRRGPERSSSLSDMASSRSPSPEVTRRVVNGKGKRPAVDDEDEDDDEPEPEPTNGLAPAAVITNGTRSEALDSESDLSDAESVVSLSSVASAASTHTVTQSANSQPTRVRNARSRKAAPQPKQARATKAAGRPRGSTKRSVEPSLTPVRATRATVTMPAGYIEGVTTTRLPRAGQGGARVKSETPMVVDGPEDEAEEESSLGAVKVGADEVEVDDEPIASQATTAITLSRAATPEPANGFDSVVDTPSGAATPLDRRSPSPSLSKSTSVSSSVMKPNVVVTEVDEDGDVVRTAVKEEEEGSVEPEVVSPRKKAAKTKAKSGVPPEPERELSKRRKVEEPSARSAARRMFLDQLDLEADQIKAGTHPLVPAALRRLKDEKGMRLAHAGSILAEREDELVRQMETKVFSIWRQWADNKDKARIDLYLTNHEKLKAIVEEEKTFPFLRDHPLLVNHRGLPPAPYYRAPVLEEDCSFVARQKFASGHFLQPPPLDRAVDHSAWEMAPQDVADDLALFAGYNPESPYGVALPVAPVAVAVALPVPPPLAIAPVPVQAAVPPPVAPTAAHHSQQHHTHPPPPAVPDMRHPVHAPLPGPAGPPGPVYGYPPPGFYYDAPPPPPGMAYQGHAYPPPPPHGWPQHDDPYARQPPPREELQPPPPAPAPAPRRTEYDYAAEHRAKQDDITRRLHGKNAPKSAWAGGRDSPGAIGGGASSSASAARAVGGGYGAGGGANEAKAGTGLRSSSDLHGGKGTQGGRAPVGHAYGGYSPGERRALPGQGAPVNGGGAKGYGGAGVAYEVSGQVKPAKSEAKPWSGDSLYGQPGPPRAGAGAGAGAERARYSYWG